MIVLDTHVLVWLDAANEKLGRETLSLIDEAFRQDELAVSAISFWEVAMLERKGRLKLGQRITSWRRDFLDRGLLEIPVDGVIAVAAGALEDFHGDPADRMIVSTAASGARLATADRAILDWKGDLPRIDARK